MKAAPIFCYSSLLFSFCDANLRTQKTSLLCFYIVQQSCRWGFLHFDVGEEFLASVLQTGTEDIHHIVDNQETVVIALRGVDVNRWICA